MFGPKPREIEDHCLRNERCDGKIYDQYGNDIGECEIVHQTGWYCTDCGPEHKIFVSKVAVDMHIATNHKN